MDHNIHNHMNTRLSKSGGKKKSVVLSHSVYGSHRKLSKERKKNQDWKAVDRFGHMMVMRGLSKWHFRGEFWEMKGKWKSGKPVSMPAPIHSAIHLVHQSMLWIGAPEQADALGHLPAYSLPAGLSDIHRKKGLPVLGYLLRNTWDWLGSGPRESLALLRANNMMSERGEGAWEEEDRAR